MVGSHIGEILPRVGHNKILSNNMYKSCKCFANQELLSDTAFFFSVVSYHGQDYYVSNVFSGRILKK